MSKANPRFRRTNPLLPAPTNNVYRVRFYGTIEGQLTINTFYYLDDAPLATATPALALGLVNGMTVAANMRDKLMACSSADWTCTQIVVDSPTSPTLAAQSVAVNGIGTGPAGHEPTTVSVTMAKLSGVKGQCGRGRVATPAVPTAWVTASTLTTLASHNALAAQMQATITQAGHTYSPCIFSRGNRTTKQFGSTLLTNVLVRTVLGTVRRRKLGRGK